MTGPKLNEKSFVVGERSGTKATAKYVRASASKARVVLDLIRGLDVRRADEVLRFSDRGAAADVRKVLASAVANAVHNFEQDVEELFVVACYADEGPTLKRFRPRARGSASRIRKRSCHVTVVVARNLPREYPYYALALPDGWSGVAELEALPDGFQKKTYRNPDNYKSLFRQYNEVFPGVQEQRKRSNPAHLRA